MKYVRLYKEFKFNDGLNIHSGEFKPFDSWNSEFHFISVKDVFSYMNLGAGNFLREVTVPDGIAIIQVDDKYKASQVIFGNEMMLWNEDTILKLYQNNAKIDDHFLRYAAQLGYIEIVKCLVGLGFDVNMFGGCILKSAVIKGNLDMVKCLIECGASLNTHYGSSAIEVAIGNKHDAVVEYLSSIATDKL